VVTGASREIGRSVALELAASVRCRQPRAPRGGNGVVMAAIDTGGGTLAHDEAARARLRAISRRPLRSARRSGGGRAAFRRARTRVLDRGVYPPVRWTSV